MPATFLFRAEKAETGEAIKVYISLGGVDRGFTPGVADKHLIVQVGQSGTYNWYAKRNGEKVGQGESSGGEIVVYL